MIRRGLQILVLVGITALGAAPCFAYTASNALVYPDRIIVQSHPNAAANGVYGSLGPDLVSAGSYWYARYGQSNNVTYTARFTENATGNGLGVSLWSGSNQIDQSRQTNRVAWSAAGWTPLTSVWYASTQFLFEFGEPDPYDAAFPDWESAATKIPLGFGFAMSFWAAAVALTISLKWVRDLASAAS